MEKLIPISDLFKKSFELYKPRMWAMFFLGLIAWVGSAVIFALVGLLGIVSFIFVSENLKLGLLMALIFLVGLLLVIIINLWVQVALMFAVREENAKSSVKDLLMMTKGRLASYYWIAFLNAVIILAGFIVFIIPGVILSIWFCFSQYAFVFEGTKGFAALSRSKELVKGYWWPVLGRILILAAITILISFISKLGFLINSLFTMPFGIMYMYVIYEDLKRVKSL